MTEWGQGYPDNDFDAAHRRMHEVTRFQTIMAAGYEKSFSEYPELTDFSGQLAATLTESALDNIGQADTHPGHPAIAQIRDCYKRIVFSFTDPANFEDRASDNAMLRFFDDVASGGSSGQAGLQELANRFDVLAGSFLVCLLVLERQGKLINMASSERFQYVQDYYDALLDGPDEAHGGDAYL